MTFTVETDYTSENMAVMARALRKTLRKRRSRRFLEERTGKAVQPV